MSGDVMPALAPLPPDLPDASGLFATARSMLDAGRPAAAEPLIAALRRLAPGTVELAELEGLLAAAEGRTGDAIGTLDRRIAEDGKDVAARMRRSGLHFRSGNMTLAMADAAEAVIAAPDNARSKTLLGLLLLEKGDLPRAIACLRDALATDPSDPEIRVGLAEAALRAGDKELARATVVEGLQRSPYRLDLRRVAVRVASALGDLAGARALAEEARHAGLVDSLLLRMQADAEAALGEKLEADEHRKLAFEIDPSDPALRAQAAALGLVQPTNRLAAPIVAHWFDTLADTFENAMIAAGDRVPGLVRQAIVANLDVTPDAVLDLGCGTGLVAIACSDLSLGPWTGVDVSPRMVALARARGLYTELVEQDILEYLNAATQSFRLIIGADVFSTFGDLSSAFAATAPRLAPGGCFILSLDESPDPAPVTLGPTGFFAHSRAALEQAASDAGLSVRSVRSEPLRDEHGLAVPGLIAVLSR